MWKLHNLAAAYSQRPSTILEIGDSWLAYQLDLACLTVGRWVENRLAERDRKGQPLYTLEALLEEREPQEDKGRFQSLASKVRRKVRIPESGIWK